MVVIFDIFVKLCYLILVKHNSLYIFHTWFWLYFNDLKHLILRRFIKYFNIYFPLKFPFFPKINFYELLCYVFVFLILFYFYWKTKKSEQQGFLFGLFLVLLWTVRFFVEYVKVSQGGIEEYFGDSLSTGQLLSIPFVIIGLYFMFFYKPKTTLN